MAQRRVARKRQHRFPIRDNVSMNIEVGGGIRDMDTVEYYLSHGINRIILGSAALHSPEFVREAVKKYGKKDRRRH